MNDSAASLATLLAKPEPIRWLFCGDSITQGALHTMGWRDYTQLFSERVRWEMQRGRDCVMNSAVSGWMLSTLSQDAQWSILQHRPHAVFMNVGMNDCAAGLASRLQFEKQYVELIDQVRQTTSAIVVVQTPNQILASDALRAPHLADYACAIRDVATKSNALLVDHFADWEPRQRDGSIAYLLSDAIHPNECGHRLMARTVLSALGAWDASSRIGRLFVP